ncbi:MAG: site-specific DNA-methyltransferase [Bryobacterales bacterium]|nr:site-specific DNA-methyltransferase [Bryobacterales bacterium]
MSGYTLLPGDCLDVLTGMSSEFVDLIYVDPPFLTQKVHRLGTRDGKKSYSFKDLWSSTEGYGDFLLERLRECHRCLKKTGSIFFHCDDNSCHISRLLLDNVFGEESFQSEIIWTYKRWSNSRRGLLPSHQTILFYAKTDSFKFNPVVTGYSQSTNIDQILQRRVRDERGKAVYARAETGEPISNGGKKGVPLGDVWEIPYLNPKARERVGYPTQKPVLLLERIIKLCTDPDDVVLDPFCGSGTALVAAGLLGRAAIGIDNSEEALALARTRLEVRAKTTPRLLEIGREEYVRKDLDLLEHLRGLEFHPVHRNKGLDAILSIEWEGKPIFIRIQSQHETVGEAADSLSRAAQNKGGAKLILIVVDEARQGLFGPEGIPEDVMVVPSAAVEIKRILKDRSRQSPVNMHATAPTPLQS